MPDVAAGDAWYSEIHPLSSRSSAVLSFVCPNTRSPAKNRKFGFGLIAATSAKVRFNSATFAVLTTPSDSGAATRLQPRTTNENATPVGSTVGPVESDPQEIPTAATNVTAAAANRRVGTVIGARMRARGGDGWTG